MNSTSGPSVPPIMGSSGPTRPELDVRAPFSPTSQETTTSPASAQTHATEIGIAPSSSAHGTTIQQDKQLLSPDEPRPTASSGIQSPSSVRPPRRLNAFEWTTSQDALLKTIAQRHSKKWVKVAVDWNRESKVKRTLDALRVRWQLLASANKASSSSQARQTPKGSAGTRKAWQRWTEEEVVTLQDSLRRHPRSYRNESHKEVIKDFLAAFPNSTRSRRSIKCKCQELLRGRWDPDSAGVLLEATYPLDGVASQSDTLAGDQDLSSTPFDGYALPSNSSSAVKALPSQAAPYFAAQATLQQQPHLEPSDQDTIVFLQLLDVHIIHEPDGVRIRCPRGLQVGIYSPSSVRVGQQLRPTPSSEGRDFEPAFLFQIHLDGSVRALRLPPATTSSMSSIPFRQRTTESVACETSWVAPDGYWVSITSI